MATATKMYSTYEAAEILDLTHGRIRQICRWSEGKIGQKLGRDWFLGESDLELIRLKFPKSEKKSSEDT